MTKTEKQVRDLSREMKFYLATAKANKALAVISYYCGLGCGAGGVVRTIQTGNLDNLLIGTVMTLGSFVCSIAFRSGNYQILREYVNARNELTQLQQRTK